MRDTVYGAAVHFPRQIPVDRELVLALASDELAQQAVVVLVVGAVVTVDLPGLCQAVTECPQAVVVDHIVERALRITYIGC
jgi:hypothetical protein